MKRISATVRFRLEAILAVIAVCLAVVTLFWHDWLEVFGFDPDNHSGAFEWVVVVGLFLLAGALGAAASIEWRVSRRVAMESGQ
jgi:hypothetical protein